MRRAGGRAALLAIPLLAACFCLTELAEVDFHWHLLTGERILTGQGIPRVDDLTFTSAGRPWIDLQWLFELLLAATNRYFHTSGLDLLKIALISGGFGMAIRAALKRSAAIVVAAVGLLAVVASQERFALRPEAASFLLLGTLLNLLESRRSRPCRLLAIPFLMALWANLHALYAVGLGVLALVLVGDLIESSYPSVAGSGLDDGAAPRPRWLGAVLALSIPATLLTPYGFASWILPLRLLFERLGTGNLYGRNIAEFQAPFGGYGTTTAIAAFGILALLFVVVSLFSLRRQRPGDLLLLGSFLILALLARRNIPLFGLIALPSGSAVIIAAARRTGRASPSPRRAFETRWARLEPTAFAVIVALVIILGVEVVTNRFYARDASQRYFGRGAAPGFYLENGAQLLRERGLQGEVLNDLTMGGYLAWRWYPDRRVFIDGRLEVHEPDLFAAYLRLQRDPAFFEDVARRDHIEAVLWSHRDSSGAAALLRHLSEGRGWHLAFADLAGALFVRDGARTRSGEAWVPVEPDDPALLARLSEQLRDGRTRSERADPVPAFMRRLLPRREIPVAAANAAIFFAIVGGATTAEALFQEALAKSPDNPMLHYDLGMVLDRAGRAAEARAAFEAALARDAGFTPARVALGLMSLRAGQPDAALEQWRLAERTGNLEPAALEARGALLAKRGQLDEAIDDYRALLRIEPGRSTARAAVARLQAANGDIVGSERSFRQALSDDPALAQAHLGLAALLASTGRLEEALNESSQAVKRGLDPKALGSEPALRVLHSNPEFQRLLQTTRRP